MTICAMFSSPTIRNTNNDLIFSRPLQVLIKNGPDQRKTSLYLTIERNVSGLKREICIRLTDEENFYFLFNLILTEDDFQLLKSQQGLLVDFSLFPQKFVDLLELCLQEQYKDTPKFLLSLNIDSYGPSSESIKSAVLDVIETNPFKHLIHLSLKLIPGSDSEIKKHLASCLQKIKVEKQEVDKRLDNTESELSEKCKYIQELLSSRTAEVEKLKRELRHQSSELTLKQNEQLSSHQDYVMELKNEYEMKMEKLKQEYALKQQRSVVDGEERAAHAEAENKILLSKLNISDSKVAELEAKIANLEPALIKANSDLQNNGPVAALYNDLKTTHGYLQNRMSAMEQEIKDKQLVLMNSQQLLQVTQEQKTQLEKQLDEKAALVAKREVSLKTLSDEVKKANEIIAKLQREIKSSHAKLKVRGQIASEQEKVLSQNDEVLKKVTAEKEALQEAEQAKDSQITKLQNELQDAQKHLKTNENVINWLNKQLNQGPGSRAPSERPQPRLLNYYDSHVQPSVNGSRMQTPVSMVTFAPTATSIPTNPPMRSAGLDEQYFKPSLPLSHSTPHIRSAIPQPRVPRPSAASGNLRTSPLATQEPGLPSAYFSKQVKSS